MEALLVGFLIDWNDRIAGNAYSSCKTIRLISQRKVQMVQKLQPSTLRKKRGPSSVIARNVEILEQISRTIKEKHHSDPVSVLALSDYGSLNHDKDEHENIELVIDHNLEPYGLSRIPVPKDGDCIFHAILTSLFSRKDLLSDGFLQNLMDIGIQLEEGKLFDLAIVLRNVAVQQLEKDSHHYFGFISNMEIGEFLQECQTYRRPGVYAGDIGDLIPRVIADMLGIQLIIVSSNGQQLIQSISAMELVCPVPIFVAYFAQGCGHYDGTCMQSYPEESPVTHENLKSSDSHTQEEPPTCRCGKGSAGVNVKKGVCAHNRCECYRKGLGCKDCTCKSCTNPKGPRHLNEVSKTFKPSQKPKVQRQHTQKLERLSGYQSLKLLNIEVRDVRWSEKETLLLHEVLKQKKTKDSKEVYQIYNQICFEEINDCRKKTYKQIVSKLAHMSKYSNRFK